VTGPYREGDLVGVNHLGRQFLAVVVSEKGQELSIRPVPKNVTYFHIPKRDVRTIYRLAKGASPVFTQNGGIVYRKTGA
jgi:hypothetical protein